LVGFYGAGMPVEFLFDREVAAYGRYVCAPSPAEPNRFFFLDDAVDFEAASPPHTSTQDDH